MLTTEQKDAYIMALRRQLVEQQAELDVLRARTFLYGGLLGQVWECYGNKGDISADLLQKMESLVKL